MFKDLQGLHDEEEEKRKVSKMESGYVLFYNQERPRERIEPTNSGTCSVGFKSIGPGRNIKTLLWFWNFWALLIKGLKA